LVSVCLYFSLSFLFSNINLINLFRIDGFSSAFNLTITWIKIYLVDNSDTIVSLMTFL
jgi:hypothetical protein